MRAVAFREYGGPEVLEVLELPDPEPGPGQVRIRVAAATVNPSDTLFRSGGLARGIDGPPPWVAGLELAGVVDAVGDGTGYEPGERVAAMTRFLPHGRGAQSELLVLDAESSLARVPEGLDLVEAATVPMTGLTVRLLLDTLELPPGSTVAVHRRGRCGRGLRRGARRRRGPARGRDRLGRRRDARARARRGRVRPTR